MASSLSQRLENGEVLLLDGAIGTELQRRGAPMDSVAWCAVATETHPDLLRQIHLDYIEAGADIITTNTFSTTRHVLEPAGLGERTEEINRTAVELARRAVEESGSDVLIAGSMSSMGPLGGPSDPPDGETAARSYVEQAGILADAGVDLILAEMLCDLTHATRVIEAAKRTTLPLLVGWSAAPGEDGGVVPYRSRTQGADHSLSFEELVQQGGSLGGEVAGIMHSEVAVTGPALEILARNWDSPLMAYAETGRFEPPNWVFTDTASPDRYAAAAEDWVRSGVRIVGGCCGTTPEHIAVLRSTLR